MSSERLVSVVIVNFNTGELLTDCVKSVLASTVPVEVFVSDNGSKDGSVAFLRKAVTDPRLQIIENGDNLGFAKANNLVLPRVNGDYLLFLNPDCFIQPHTLEKMRLFMEGNPTVGMAGCLIQNLDGTEQAGCRRYVPTPWRSFVRVFKLSRLFKNHPKFRSFNMEEQPLPENPVPVEAISGAFMLVRRQALEQVGLLDEKYFMHCEDLDWCMRFRQMSWQIFFVPEVEVVHTKGASSAGYPIRVELYKHRGMVRFYHKFFRHQYPGFLMLGVMLMIWARFVIKASFLYLSNFTKSSAMLTVDHRLGRQKNQRAPSLVVSGATSQIGFFLLPQLREEGLEIYALSRSKSSAPQQKLGIHWLKVDLNQGLASLPPAITHLIHLAPLWCLPKRIEELAQRGLTRVVAFSSTSRFTKEQSPNLAERQIATNLIEAERQFIAECERHHIAWTLFRPTMVYGCGLDKNVSFILKLIKMVGFFPMAGEGKGLRQPVHADDLAAACVRVLNCPLTYNRAYNLSGGQTLTYYEMVATLFRAANKKVRIVRVSPQLLRFLLKATIFLPKYRNLNQEMVNRMNRDLCFDHQDATRDFGYAPRAFKI